VGYALWTRCARRFTAGLTRKARRGGPKSRRYRVEERASARFRGWQPPALAAGAADAGAVRCALTMPWAHPRAAETQQPRETAYDLPGCLQSTRDYPFRPVVTMPCTKYFCATKNNTRQGSATTMLAAIKRWSFGGPAESWALVVPCIK